MLGKLEFHSEQMEWPERKKMLRISQDKFTEQ